MAGIFPRFKFIFIGKVIIIILTILTPGGISLSSEDFYPFGKENGDEALPKGDDGFVSVSLRPGFAFPFFNESYTSLWVNINGAISFKKEVTRFTPDCSSSDQPMITPFLADVHTGNGGDVFYRETRNQNLLQRVNQDIRKGFPYLWSVKMTTMFIATWSNVSFFRKKNSCRDDPRNSFQLILSTDGTHSFAIFYYGALQWTTGMASEGNCSGLGGFAAKAGFDYGDNQTFFKLPGSCSSDILKVAQSSNMDENGKWIFRIDSALQPSGCDPDHAKNVTLQITPSFVRSLGHIPLRIRGPCLEKSRVKKVTCHFHEQEVVSERGFLVEDKNDSSVVCQVPFLYANGRIKVTLVVEYRPRTQDIVQRMFKEEGRKEITFTGFIYVMEGHPDFRAKFDEKKKGRLRVNLEWDPKLMSNQMEGQGPGQKSQPTRLEIHMIESNGTTWRETDVLKTTVPNTGNFSLTFKPKELLDLISFRITPKLVDDPGTKESSNKRTKRGIGKLSEMLGQNSLFSTVSSIFETSLMTETQARKRCLSWYDSDPGVTEGDLEQCPPLVSQAQTDPRFATRENIWLISQIHNDTFDSFIQRTPAASGAGRECVYGKDGQLIVGPPQGGASNRFSPLATFGFLPHFYRDILPYHFCCRTGRDDLCLKYYQKRPSSNVTQYSPPRSARAVGDPHIVTYDLTSYSFNGVGEFWMMKAQGDSSHNFSMQARMEPLVSGEGNDDVVARASVFTAFVMTDGTTKIQVQISSSNSTDFDILLDDDLVVLDDEQAQVDVERSAGGLGQGQVEGQTGHFVLPCKTATIEKKGNTVIVSYSVGLSFTMTANSNDLELTSEVASNIKTTLPQIQGLLGDIDGDSENDLRALNGTVIPVNSTLRQIHYEFGLSWMTSPNDSLFFYPEGKNYETYSEPEFEPNLIIPDPADLPENITTLCNGSPECLFDYVASGNSLNFARQTLETIETFNDTVDTLTQKIDLCEDIISLENGHVTFSNLFEGSSVFFECDEGADLIGAANLTCVKDETSIRWSGNWPRCFKPQEFTCPTNSSFGPCTCQANAESSSNAGQGSGPQILCSGPEVTQSVIDQLFKDLRSINSITNETKHSLQVHKLTFESTDLEQLDLSPLTQSKVKVTQLNIHSNPKLISIVGPLLNENEELDLHLIDAFELSIVGSALNDEGLGHTLSHFSNSMSFLTISESKIRGPPVQVPIQSQKISTESKKMSKSESESEFFPGLSTLKNLTYLNLDHNQIRRVEKHAFTSLPKLRFLSMSNNLLGDGGELKLDAFVSESQSKQNLPNPSLFFIRLSSNRLTIKNFNTITNQTLPPVSRPLKLDLTYNQLNRVPSSFFQPLLLANSKNQINVRQNPIMCNRLMQWLKTGAKRFQRQVLHIDCKNDPHRTVFTSRFL